jgi:N-methylhydantoinase B/oxoprolinase/acetone carboxylase alpha subunit
MFWIGLIVGVILTIVSAIAYLLYCMNVSGISGDDFNNGVDALHTAWSNRESTIEVWHDDKPLSVYTFKENL